MIENRNLSVELCAAIELKVANTCFRKPSHKTTRYRKRKETDGTTNEPVTADTHGRPDYTLTSRRWKTQSHIQNLTQKLI